MAGVLEDMKLMASSRQGSPLWLANLCAEAQRAWQQSGDATHLTWAKLARAWVFASFAAKPDNQNTSLHTAMSLEDLWTSLLHFN